MALDHTSDVPWAQTPPLVANGNNGCESGLHPIKPKATQIPQLPGGVSRSRFDAGSPCLISVTPAVISKVLGRAGGSEWEEAALPGWIQLSRFKPAAWFSHFPFI